VRIEVLCTGDELLSGLTTDTNSPYFMGKLFDMGEKVARSQTVGDVREHIIEALTSVRTRADAVLVSGGLGPTADDLTAECAAEAARVRLIENAEVLAELKARFAKRNFAFTPNNAKQALVPEGAEVVRNPVGTAPMFIQHIEGCTLFFVPGVPREYRVLVDREVLPRIAKMLERDRSRVFRAARLLKTIGRRSAGRCGARLPRGARSVCLRRGPRLVRRRGGVASSRAERNRGHRRELYRRPDRRASERTRGRQQLLHRFGGGLRELDERAMGWRAPRKLGDLRRCFQGGRD